MGNERANVDLGNLSAKQYSLFSVEMHCSISRKEVCQRSIVEKGTKLGTRRIQVTMEAISVRKFGEELLIPTIITLDGDKNKYIR